MPLFIVDSPGKERLKSKTDPPRSLAVWHREKLTLSIEFNCHVCGKLLRTSDDRAGKTASCPGCGETLTVPGSTDDEDRYRLQNESVDDEDNSMIEDSTILKTRVRQPVASSHRVECAIVPCAENKSARTQRVAATAARVWVEGDRAVEIIRPTRVSPSFHWCSAL